LCNVNNNIFCKFWNNNGEMMAKILLGMMYIMIGILFILLDIYLFTKMIKFFKNVYKGGREWLKHVNIKNIKNT
jgi:flagellar biogenesis protein FliO